MASMSVLHAICESTATLTLRAKAKCPNDNAEINENVFQTVLSVCSLPVCEDVTSDFTHGTANTGTQINFSHIGQFRLSGLT